MKMIQTKIQSYYYDISITADKLAYDALCENMKVNNIKCFEASGSYYFTWCKDSKIIQLKNKHLFNNQWITAPIDGVSDKGLRVFDWAQDYIPLNYSKNIKKGHYLVITEEIKKARENRLQCGYTGKQILKNEKPEHGFNLDALISEYLTEDYLHLIRYEALNVGKRAELSESEKSFLMPLFLEAQIKSKKLKSEAERLADLKKLNEEYENTIIHAKNKRDGFQWLFDNNFSLNNWIYYDHTKTFCFGWRSDGVDLILAETMRKNLVGFPAKYEIKIKGR
jgi:hypothetical protein